MSNLDDFEMPMAKRQKQDQQPISRREGSRLFAPFRTIGLVSPTSVPFTSVPLGKTTFQITTSVGRSLQTYDLRRGLQLVFLSRPQCPEIITATCAYRDRIFAAFGQGTNGARRGLWVLRRGKLIQELELNNTVEQPIETIVVFGVWVIAGGPRAIEVWRNGTYEHYTTILPTSQAAGPDGRVLSGCICTLPTFLNKILVGRQDGGVEICNISTGRTLHTLTPPSQTSGKVTALCPAPALSLLAIAYEDGSIVITDVDSDNIIMDFRQTHTQDPITSISFRSDGAGAGDDGRQDGVMATASSRSGDIALWDLNKNGKLAGVLRGAHEVSANSQDSGISKIEFLTGQAVLVSSGLDNSLRSWVFDQVPFSPVPRPLHARSGHAAPVTNLRFLPAASDGSEAAGKWLLSAGQDRSLWSFSLRKDGQSSELSQGNVKSKAKRKGIVEAAAVEDLKAPPITAIACSLNRDGGIGAVGGPVWTNPKINSAEQSGMTGWESVVTAHEGDRYARTWFWGRKKAGRWMFESGDRQAVTSVAVTSCGTFAVVGSARGSLDMFNLQSGMHRQRFPPKMTPAQAKQLKIQQAQSDEPVVVERGHGDAITGIVVDSLNQTMVSTSRDGTVIFWEFATGRILRRINLDMASATAIRYNSVSGLLSMACDDLCIRVVDIETKKVVRELWGCIGQIYDHCFSHDGRWIVACSMDSVIRVFDLATGHLIDGFRVPTCTNVAFSSTGEFLATSHAGQIGINIWNNKTLFTHIATRQIDDERGIIDLTDAPEFDAVSQLAVQEEVFVDEINDEGQQGTSEIDQLDSALLTLSLVPQSRWQTLLNLDTIRERNKPIAPPEKPKAAPFFLGSSTLDDRNGQLSLPSSDPNAVSLKISEEEQSRISRLASLASGPASQGLTTSLSTFKKTSDPTSLTDYLSALNPSSTDLLIRTLSLAELPTFIAALTARLKQKRDFELVNTWMSLILRLHGEFVSQVPEVHAAVVAFKTAMDSETTRLEGLVGWCRGVGDFLRSAR